MVGACFKGFTSQAASSKPPGDFLSGMRSVAVGAGSERSSTRSPATLCLKVWASTTSSFCTAGAGRPFRVLFLSAPPGPENNPPPLPVGEIETPPSSSLLITSSPPKLTFLGFDFSPVRPYLVSRYFITLRISPSFRPSVRSTGGVISGSTDSSIESRAKLDAYLSHWW